MAVDIERRRARWRRNKRDARARVNIPKPVSHKFAALVEAERKRRAARCERLRLWGACHFNPVNDSERWEPAGDGRRLGRYIVTVGGVFAADVWAARELIRAERSKVTPTRIANRLADSGRWQEYKRSSLRTMIYKALGTSREKGTIALLQDTLDDDGKPYWSPFQAIAA